MYKSITKIHWILHAIEMSSSGRVFGCCSELLTPQAVSMMICLKFWLTQFLPIAQEEVMLIKDTVGFYCRTVNYNGMLHQLHQVTPATHYTYPLGLLDFQAGNTSIHVVINSICVDTLGRSRKLYLYFILFIDTRMLQFVSNNLQERQNNCRKSSDAIRCFFGGCGFRWCNGWNTQL